MLYNAFFDHKILTSAPCFLQKWQRLTRLQKSLVYLLVVSIVVFIVYRNSNHNGNGTIETTSANQQYIAPVENKDDSEPKQVSTILLFLFYFYTFPAYLD